MNATDPGSQDKKATVGADFRGPGSRWAVDLSDSLLQAGLKLSADVEYGQLSDQLLSGSAGVDVADFRHVFGDLEAYIHVLQQRLAQEMSEALRAALWSEGSRRERLQQAAQVFLNLSLARRGAHGWVAELSRRSAPLLATRHKHARQFARILESELCDAWSAAAEAESRMLVAALREAARQESVHGAMLEQMREAVGGFIRICTEAEDWTMAHPRS